jgi:putative PIN family toxin of toxin-antitoxin system
VKRWVIDTNVVVSGLLSANGPCARILDAVVQGRVNLVYDARILAEYRDVLCRPRLKLKPALVMHFLEALSGQFLVTAERAVAGGPDPDDQKFVEVALAVPDRTIVTGNLADFPSRILHGVRLLTPVQALAELRR